jgi:hypothetical protein
MDQYSKHAVVLDPDECSDRRREYGYADHEPPCRRSRGLRPTGGEQRDAGNDKDELGRCADRNIDHHGGDGLRSRDTALMRKSRADDVAADTGDRQQGADGFADPTHPKEAEAARTVRSRKQLSPGGCVKTQGQEMKQRNRQEPPAKDQHGGGHLGGAAVDDKKNDKQEAEKRGDDERW